MCELHFAPEDITQEASYIDEETGRTVTAPLLSPRILPGVIPSKFPSCPAYLSKECARRESPDSKRKRLEAAAIQAALAESAETSRREQQADTVQLSKQEVFLKLSNQRKVVTDLTVELLSNDESSDFDACDDGHSCELVLKYVLWCSTNILLKNFCCRINDKILESHSKSKKRKLETLSKK